jgi:hypothetical protein
MTKSFSAAKSSGVEAGKAASSTRCAPRAGRQGLFAYCMVLQVAAHVGPRKAFASGLNLFIALFGGLLEVIPSGFLSSLLFNGQQNETLLAETGSLGCLANTFTEFFRQIYGGRRHCIRSGSGLQTWHL